jgi:hypothetical protein
MRRDGGTESRDANITFAGESLPVQQRRMDLRVAGRTPLQ